MFLLETERLLIRHLQLDDAPFILGLVNSEGWLRFIGDRNIHSISDAENYLKTGPLKSYQEFGYGLFRVALKGSNTAIGINGILKRPELEFPDLGFAFLPEFEGKGYAFESSQTVLGWAKTAGLKKLLAITTPENTRSQKLLTKLGFGISDSTNKFEKPLLKYLKKLHL